MNRLHGLILRIAVTVVLVGMHTGVLRAQDATDPFLWLEDVTSERALEWVRAWNAVSTEELSDDEFRVLDERLKNILDSDQKIPYVTRIGAYYYNLWTDADHPRGLWRRTVPESYAKPPTQWETVLDLDALGAREGESWVWRGAVVLKPDADRALIRLSRGGADATVVREFDLVEKAFVEKGFELPEGKNRVSWRDRDSLWIGADLGGHSMTASGYPRTVRLWRRGTPVSAAEIDYEGEQDDVYVVAAHIATPGHEQDVLIRRITFWTSRAFIRVDGSWVEVDKPLDAELDLYRQWLLLELRSDWLHDGQQYKAGSLLAVDLHRHLNGKGRFSVLFEPSERVSLAAYEPTRHHVLLTTLDNVRTRIDVLTPREEGGWSRQRLEGLPEFGEMRIRAVEADLSDEYFLNLTGFLTPPSLYDGTVGAGPPRQLRATPAFFDTNGLGVSQHEVTSKDGTRVPYFLVRRQSEKLDGEGVTLLYAYGGFEIPMLPRYDPLRGAAWLERGGAFVLANIRGGGEFGPTWHQAALKANRPRAYEDLAAVAEDLIQTGVTSPERLGVMGGSNGGLLVGNMITRYPALFGAAVCQAPLLDMRRYHLLLAGASWMDEYGDPDDPDQWQFIRTFSPYHNVVAGAEYPRTLFMSSTRDDRVHPAHARKMVAKMAQQEHDVLYYENVEGGHGGAADNAQRATMSALAYRFLWRELGAAGDRGEAARP
jgi:prolyl oligopeptidase